MSPNILTKEDFSKEIEQFVLRTGAGYVEAVVHFCELKNIEPETAAKLLNVNVKTMIEKESIDLNLLTERPETLTFE